MPKKKKKKNLDISSLFHASLSHKFRSEVQIWCHWYLGLFVRRERECATEMWALSFG